METGELIIYTSSARILQIAAAHEDYSLWMNCIVFVNMRVQLHLSVQLSSRAVSLLVLTLVNLETSLVRPQPS